MWSLAEVTASAFLISFVLVKAEIRTEIAQRMLDDIISTTRYDPRIRPDGKSKRGPAVVRVNAYIRSISDIDDTKMEYSVQMKLRQQWMDKRLNFSNAESYDEYIHFLTLKDADKIWRPDIFFKNEKEVHFHNTLMPSTLIRIYPLGDILYSQRLSLKLDCPMDLRNYPLDRQTCRIQISSDNYSTEDMELLWKEINPVAIKKVNILTFSLVSFKTGSCIDKSGTGEYPCLEIDITFTRNLKHYLLSTYIPSIIIVLLSWIPFWLNQAAIVARFIFGGALLLAIIVIISAFYMNAPVASYLTAADVYFGTSLILLCVAVIEYAFVAKMDINVTTERNVDYKSVEDSLAKNHLMNTEDEAMKEDKQLANRNPIVYIKRWLKKHSSRGQKIDVISRFLFPFAYVVFNIAYWSYYA